MTSAEPTIDIGPIEHSPSDIYIRTRSRHRLIVSATKSGVVVVAQADEVEQGIQVVTRSKVLTALNPANAISLSDALIWASAIAEPRQLNL
jgi:hypothetical protein